MERSWRTYSISSPLGGSIDVVVEVKDIALNGERNTVGHAGWCKLFENKRDKWGNLTNYESDTGRMLRQLCDRMGSNVAHNKFTAGIEFDSQGEIEKESV